MHLSPVFALDLGALWGLLKTEQDPCTTYFTYIYKYIYIHWVSPKLDHVFLCTGPLEGRAVAEVSEQS